MKTILVTGAAGFIGGNLVLKLLKTNNFVKVIGLDNMNDYYDVSLKKYRLKLIDEAAKNFSGAWKFYRGDLSDKNFIQKIFEENRPRTS